MYDASMGELEYPHPYKPVRRVTGQSLADIQSSLDDDEPVLYVNALGNQPFFEALKGLASEREKLAFLAEQFGERPVDVNYAAAGAVNARRVEKMPFAKVAEILTAQIDDPSGERAYMQNQPIDKFPEVGWKPLELAQHKLWHHAHTGLWLGAGGHTVPFHYDNASNFITMLVGKKRVSLLPFEALPNMYALFDLDKNVTCSAVQHLAPDWEKFPKYRAVQDVLQVAVVEPGDVLLVPPHWWHHVESFGLNLMVNSWSVPFPLDTWRAIGKARGEAIMLFRELSQDQRDRYAAVYDDTVFRTGTAAPPIDNMPAAIAENLATSAALFELAPESWRRRGSLAYRYFVFQRFGPPMAHTPGAEAAFLDYLGRRLAAGDRLSPLG